MRWATSPRHGSSADNAGLPGTFKAFLATGTEGPITTFIHSTTAYVRVAGVKIADDWVDLGGSALDAELNVTEYGTPPPGASFCNPGEPMAWSNASPDGAPRNGGNHCSDWTAAPRTGLRRLRQRHGQLVRQLHGEHLRPARVAVLFRAVAAGTITAPLTHRPDRSPV